jgi:hypothetical protein
MASYENEPAAAATATGSDSKTPVDQNKGSESPATVAEEDETNNIEGEEATDASSVAHPFINLAIKRI